MTRVGSAALAALFAASAAQAQQSWEAAPARAAAAPSLVLLPQAASSLTATPALSAPFGKLQPVARGYLVNQAEPDRMPRNPAAFGRYVTDPRLLAGVNLAPWLALEAGYVNLFDRGTFLADYSRPWDVAGALGVAGFHTHAGARIGLPVGERIEAFGKVGIAYSENNQSDAQGRAVTDTDAGLYVGMGARYKVSGKTSVTARYERYGDTERKWGTNSNNNGVKAKVNIGF